MIMESRRRPGKLKFMGIVAPWRSAKESFDKKCAAPAFSYGGNHRIPPSAAKPENQRTTKGGGIQWGRMLGYV
jgi:hypothetical protein